ADCASGRGAHPGRCGTTRSVTRLRAASERTTVERRLVAASLEPPQATLAGSSLVREPRGTSTRSGGERQRSQGEAGAQSLMLEPRDPIRSWWAESRLKQDPPRIR